MTSCALTLLPASSSLGEKTVMAPWPGIMAIMPPPTPLLAGSPTLHAQPPDPSYRPAEVIVARMCGMFSDLITCLPVNGFLPLLARVAAIIPSCLVLTPTEHCFVYLSLIHISEPTR